MHRLYEEEIEKKELVKKRVVNEFNSPYLVVDFKTFQEMEGSGVVQYNGLYGFFRNNSFYSSKFDRSLKFYVYPNVPIQFTELEKETLTDKQQIYLSENYKKQVLEQMGIKNIETTIRPSQKSYTASEEIKRLVKERQEYSDKLAQTSYLVHETPLLKAHRIEQEKLLKKGGEVMDDLIKKGNRNIGSLMAETLKILIEEELERKEETDVNYPTDTIDKCLDMDFIKRIKCEPSEMTTSEITTGKKENKGKLYYELSWEFIEEMAKRMASNKSDKYPLYNWKKNIDIEELKQAINRHHIEVMKGNYKDGEEVLGNIVSYACNSMMLWEQLNKK